MHFLFTAPRYHTNQHFAAKALVDAGHTVSYLVVGKGRSETYEAVDPEVLAISAVSRTLGRLLARRSHRPFELQCACPPRHDVLAPVAETGPGRGGRPAS